MHWSCIGHFILWQMCHALVMHCHALVMHWSFHSLTDVRNIKSIDLRNGFEEQYWAVDESLPEGWKVKLSMVGDKLCESFLKPTNKRCLSSAVQHLRRRGVFWRRGYWRQMEGVASIWLQWRQRVETTLEKPAGRRTSSCLLAGNWDAREPRAASWWSRRWFSRW